MESIKWERYPRLAGSESAKAWITIQINLGLARNTVEAYGRALEDYLTFCERHALVPESVGGGTWPPTFTICRNGPIPVVPEKPAKVVQMWRCGWRMRRCNNA